MSLRFSSRLAAAPLIVAVLFACESSAPKSYTVPIPVATPDVWACAHREMSTRGYTVTTATPNAGSVRAERRDGGPGAGSLATALATVGVVRPNLKQRWDELTVSLYEDAVADQQMRVTAASSQEDRGARIPRKATDAVRADARAVLSACAR